VHVLGKANKEKSGLKLGSEKSYSRTKLSEYIFKGASIHDNLCMSTEEINIIHINSDQC